ncbi:MAG: hypothetical protein ACK52L_07735 [Pirellula sp.]
MTVNVVAVIVVMTIVVVMTVLSVTVLFTYFQTTIDPSIVAVFG